MKSRHKGIGQACGGGQHTNATMVGAWALAGLLCNHGKTENLCLGSKALGEHLCIATENRKFK